MLGQHANFTARASEFGDWAAAAAPTPPRTAIAPVKPSRESVVGLGLDREFRESGATADAALFAVQPLPAVFERVDWSTDRVLAQTRERLQEAGATWQELPALWDVDESADWHRWQSLGATSSAASEPEAGLHAGHT